MPIGHSHVPSIPDVEVSEDIRYLRESYDELIRTMRGLSHLIEGTTRRVDEYRPQTLTPDSELSITLQPQFERFSERITSVLVTGPATQSFTLQLGSRVWSLTLPATGFIVIAPIAILLDPSSPRVLTAGSQGDWSIELMGDADVRNRP